MNNIGKIIRGNIQCLSQIEAVIDSLSFDEYKNKAQPFKGVGVHVRHIVEHYDQLFSGIVSGKINYDERVRCSVFEVNKEAAGKKLRLVQKQLQELLPADPKRSLILAACTDSTSSSIVENISTSLERELLFMHQHAIHHCAQIAIILFQSGRDVSDFFGTAPATLKHQRDKLAKQRI